MALTIEQHLTPYNFSDRPAGGRKIEYIVIHYFGSLGTAKAVANYFASAYRGASAHYCLDEGSTVYQCVLEEDVAWHCGTSGTYYHPDCRNSNSIGIEVRPYKLDPSTATDATKRDWYFTEEIIENLVEFTAALMRKYDIPPERVVRHYDVTHKWCPRPFMGDDINQFYGESGNTMWEKFKERIEEETQMRFNTMEQIEEKASYALPTVQKLVSLGYLQGGGKKDAEGNPADMDLSKDMLRVLVINDRAGVYGE